MGCGRSAMEDDYREERNKEILEGFRAIASDDKLILRFAERLEDINRQLHNFQGHDLELRRENHSQISSALKQVEDLNHQIRTLKMVKPESPERRDRKPAFGKP